MPSARYGLVAAVLLITPRPADAQTRMLRSPKVSKTNIVFAYAGNIWIVKRAGGPARRLTTFAGEAGNPKLTPTASSSRSMRNTPATSTSTSSPWKAAIPSDSPFHPGAELVRGWTPDGKQVVFASTRASNGLGAIPRFYTIGLDGSVETAMPQPRAYEGIRGPDQPRRQAPPLSHEQQRRRGAT